MKVTGPENISVQDKILFKTGFIVIGNFRKNFNVVVLV
jgi:hypothetical protein